MVLQASFKGYILVVVFTRKDTNEGSQELRAFTTNTRLAALMVYC